MGKAADNALSEQRVADAWALALVTLVTETCAARGMRTTDLVIAMDCDEGHGRKTGEEFTLIEAWRYRPGESADSVPRMPVARLTQRANGKLNVAVVARRTT